MAKELPYFKFDCAEYLFGDISAEDFYSQGLFYSICAYYWRRNCCMTMAQLKRRYASAIQSHIADLCDRTLIKVDQYENLHINFLDEQLKERQKSTTQKSSAGKSGAYARWHPHRSANATAMANHGNKEVDKEVDKDKDKNNPSPPKVEKEVPFNIFWKRYPKKVGKQAARRAWKTHKAKLQEVLESLSWQIASEDWTKEGGKYIPNPATYLNQHRWEDEPMQKPAGPEVDPEVARLMKEDEEAIKQWKERTNGLLT